MKVKQLKKDLAALPPECDDLEVLDEYAESILTRVYKSTYEDNNGTHDYIVLEMDRFEPKEEEEHLGDW